MANGTIDSVNLNIPLFSGVENSFTDWLTVELLTAIFTASGYKTATDGIAKAAFNKNSHYLSSLNIKNGEINFEFSLSRRSSLRP